VEDLPVGFEQATLQAFLDCYLTELLLCLAVVSWLLRTKLCLCRGWRSRPAKKTKDQHWAEMKSKASSMCFRLSR